MRSVTAQRLATASRSRAGCQRNPATRETGNRGKLEQKET